ncbi:MAG: hypothetical protein JWM95_4503 [Gemmatimonadetes bacterium]|nr:hypothetical protein [Gemmatimonadota bacterium]
MTISRIVRPLVLGLAFASAAKAQQLAPAAFHTGPAAVRDAPAPPQLHSQQAYFADGAARLVLSAAGSVAGAYMGASVGNSLSTQHDLAGLGDVIVGAVVGSALGAGLLGSAPAMHSRCTAVARIGLGLLGSAAGSAVGFAIGEGARNFGGLVYGPMAGAIIGTTVAADLCGQ